MTAVAVTPRHRAISGWSGVAGLRRCDPAVSPAEQDNHNRRVSSIHALDDRHAQLFVFLPSLDTLPQQSMSLIQLVCQIKYLISKYLRSRSIASYASRR
jgi:hypothetical protein